MIPVLCLILQKKLLCIRIRQPGLAESELEGLTVSLEDGKYVVYVSKYYKVFRFVFL